MKANHHMKEVATIKLCYNNVNYQVNVKFNDENSDLFLSSFDNLYDVLETKVQLVEYFFRVCSISFDYALLNLSLCSDQSFALLLKQRNRFFIILMPLIRNVVTSNMTESLSDNIFFSNLLTATFYRLPYKTSFFLIKIVCFPYVLQIIIF